MKSVKYIFTILSCVCSLVLHAQETYLWTEKSEGFDVVAYEMHKIDFLNAIDIGVLFRIDADRFTHPDMTGISNRIRSFDYNADRSQVYFMEEEGDLYRYTVASDDLEYLGDMTPETTPFLIVHGYTQINDIFFLNDSLLYCAGFTYGEYNINTGIFSKIREPANNIVASTRREQEIDCTKYTKYKDQHIYISGPGAESIMLMDLENPDNNSVLFDYSSVVGANISHNSIVAYQYDCDSVDVFVYGDILGQGNGNGFFKINMETGVATYSHDVVQIPNSGGPLFPTIRHYPEPSWEDCQRYIDLDTDDSTIGGVDFLIDSLCGFENLPLSDIDIRIRNEYPIDSIDIAIINPMFSQYLYFPVGNYILKDPPNPWQRIINNGSTTIADLENAIRNAYLDIDGDAGISEIQIRFTVWYDGIEGMEAIAILRLATPLPSSGDDITQQWCEGDKNLSFDNILASNADEGGDFYDKNFLELSAIPDYVAPISDTIYYVTTNGICYDTAQIINVVNPNPIINPISDSTMCYNESLEIDLTNYIEDVEWNDGSNDKVRSFDQSGIFSYELQNLFGCTSSDTFEVTKISAPQSKPMEARVCIGEQFLFMDQVYTEAGNYQDTLMGSLGCDSIIYLIDFDFYERIPIEIEGDLGFCDGESTVIEVVSMHDQLRINGEEQTDPFTINEEGEYSLSGYDINGCFEELDISIDSYPTPTIITNDLIDTVFVEGLELPVSYQGDIESYNWSPSFGLDCDDCPNPKLVSAEEGYYTIEVENEHGCLTSNTITVSFKESNFYIPNIISNYPNTPINGIFFLQGNSYQQYELNIFDRWGNLLFQNENAIMNIEQDGWQPNGTVNSGVYVYMIKLTESGNTKILKGDITVIE